MSDNFIGERLGRVAYSAPELIQNVFKGSCFDALWYGINGCKTDMLNAGYEDMSGYQWHDAEKKKPKAFEDVLLMGPDNDVMVGWFDDKDGLFSAYNDAPNMGPADVKFWAYVYIPPLKAREVLTAYENPTKSKEIG